MRSKNSKISEVRDILTNGIKSAPKTWVVMHHVDGRKVCRNEGWPEDVQPHDTVINLIHTIAK